MNRLISYCNNKSSTSTTTIKKLYYSTSFGGGTLLNNTKRKNNIDRKIKVNHVSSKQIKNLIEYQYENSKNRANDKIGKKDQKEILKSEFGLNDSEILDIINSGENDRKEKEALDNKEDKKQQDSKFYISEKYYFSDDTSKDDEFIKKSLGNSKSYSEEMNNSDWKEMDLNDWKQDGKMNENIFQEKSIKELKAMELKKKGLVELDGGYYSNNYLIPNKFESYFLKPDAPTTRSEKKLFDKMDALADAKKDKMISKRGFKLMDSYHDSGDRQSIVQSRLSTRILEVLNESSLFDHSGTRNSSGVIGTDNQRSSYGQLDNMADEEVDGNLLFERGFKENKLNYFSNPTGVDSDQMEMDKSDPILSNADIELTHASMSSDLRWVKIFWKRRNHNNLNESADGGKGSGGKTIDQFIKEDDLLQIQSIQDKKLKAILSNTETNSAKQLIYDTFTPTLSTTNKSNNIKSKIGNSKILSKQTPLTNSNGTSEMINSVFNFGQNNIQSISNNKFELEISIDKHLSTSEKREKLLLKRYQEIIDQIDKEDKEDKEDGDDEEHYINNALPKEEIEKLKSQLSDDSTLVGTSRYKEIEKRKRKKMRSLFYEITDKDIEHRLIKLKSKVRWIIGKRVKSKYVPDVLFVKDETEIKDETSNDLVENFITPELRQLFIDKIKSEQNRISRLKSKYSGLFNSNSSTTDTTTASNNNEQVLNSIEENESDQVDLIGILREFPELLNDKVVKKYLRMERDKLKLQEKEQQQEAQEIQEEDTINTDEQIEIKNTTNVGLGQLFKDFNKGL